jgi:hypothetical protein
MEAERTMPVNEPLIVIRRTWVIVWAVTSAIALLSLVYTMLLLDASERHRVAHIIQLDNSVEQLKATRIQHLALETAAEARYSALLNKTLTGHEELMRQTITHYDILEGASEHRQLNIVNHIANMKAEVGQRCEAAIANPFRLCTPSKVPYNKHYKSMCEKFGHIARGGPNYFMTIMPEEYDIIRQALCYWHDDSQENKIQEEYTEKHMDPAISRMMLKCSMFQTVRQ